ncbi:VirB4 family type IV secretion/conjugal transfer ATPase [Shewanella sp. 202IG2-18]|uniref:VirB4 family type IV secretion/conjugal transfer ATPase n=1 Tax=Parashewanella hymeniacidonis TaxID=2807618 RepID=UPI00196162D2|nr:VirB4 family type IV secretion/conjugal transfer ATPase [Parashewanella hymeniacidonis]MBM7070725.1 VirB4 family type IV secretion/conjugal transfer ATPase [Parashewanella hymeniacidonis]
MNIAHVLPANWHKENPVAEFVPYQTLCDYHTVKTRNSEYLQVIKLQGIAHETQDAEQVQIWKEQLNLMLRNIASPNISLWSHVIRREHQVFPEGKFDNEFDRQLNQKYAAKVCQSQLFINELYLTVIYQDGAKHSLNLFKRSQTQEQCIARQLKAIHQLDEVVNTVLSSLSEYQPKRLSTFYKDDHFYSEVLTFLDYLVNGDWQQRTLPKMDIACALPRVRPLFGNNAFALKGLTDTHFGACLSIIEYPEHTEAGLLNSLLSAPFSFILAQSFQFLSKPLATELLTRQQNRLQATGDLAQSQIDAVSFGLDELTSNRVVYGQHHLNITLFAKGIDELELHIAAVKSELADRAIIAVREDIGLKAAYWSQLPANSKYRPRPAPISSRNFSGFCGFHNYPSGQLHGNQWGSAITLFKTASGAPYYFNFHEVNRHDSRNEHQHQSSTSQQLPKLTHTSTKEDKHFDDNKETILKEEHHALGNTLIIGVSGSGKTVLQGFLTSQSKKHQPTQIIFDKDQGLEVYVRACGGLYLPLKMGKPTGFNPFQLENTPANRLFLTALLSKLLGSEIDHTQQLELCDAVEGVMALDKPLRRLSRCLEFLDPTMENGCYLRLLKWCEQGEYAWVLDNASDELDVSKNTLLAFDVTEFLDTQDVRTPIIMYLFHRIEQLIDGRRLQIFVDEFWKLLGDKYFEDFANNKQKVIRKQNGLMVYATQSAKDILASPIAHSLIEQCATFIFMPNPKARREDYIEGFNLTEREFELIHNELAPNSRQFLIKQGHDSVVVTLDLNGFEQELAVISGTTNKVNLLQGLIEQVGDKPATWLPLYFQALSEKRGEA